MRALIPLIGIALIALQGCATTGGYAPVDEDARRRATLQTQLGIGYMRQDRLEIALERLERAAESDPTYAPAQNGLALLKERLRKVDEVEGHYRRAISLDPEYAGARTNFGRFLCLADRQEEALEQFKAAVENPLYETPELAYYNAGQCKLRSNDLEEAEGFFRRSLAINQRLAPSLASMSDISLRRGKDLSARAYLQRYLELAPHTPKTLWLGVRIERKLGDRNAESSYGMLLRSKYPESPETELLLKNSQ
ncbi:MAG: type IV pilus biogenesis/stability protein PilW [Gammaproteobacteria bacterium]|nr:type IV pilus biogenesis/stability protein PilW [Gammaproteobacteria bacterium]